MPTQEDLTVQYHQQDTDYYCGAACAQMVLQTIGAGVLDQDDLYADNNGHSVAEAGWASGPDGLNWTMNDRRPASFHNSFVLFALASEDTISRKICWTIHHYQVAPIALVYGWAHWIVVRGYEASAAPAGSSDTGYSIDGFFLNNPWPPTPAGASEPPHSGGDGCGAGGDRGVADEHVTYATWQSDYMTGVPGGHWSGQFLAVCDPEAPAARPGKQVRLERESGARLITPAEASRVAGAGIKAHRLDKREGWKDVFAKTKPAAPLLVQRLDRRDSFYYIVPFQRGAGKATALARVDARYGTYAQAATVPDQRLARGLSVDARTLVAPFIGKKLELSRDRGRLLLRPEAMCIYPTLVWKPCRESLSPMWPFRMITVGAERLYVRIDGMIFTELHDDIKGF